MWCYARGGRGGAGVCCVCSLPEGLTRLIYRSNDGEGKVESLSWVYGLFHHHLWRGVGSGVTVNDSLSGQREHKLYSEFSSDLLQINTTQIHTCVNKYLTCLFESRCWIGYVNLALNHAHLTVTTNMCTSIT